MSSALPDLLVEPPVRAALLEDLGRSGDLTAMVLPRGLIRTARITARQGGCIAGLAAARLAFHLVDPALTITTPPGGDGSCVAAGATVMEVHGPAASILTAERTALNFLAHLSGVATATAAMAAAIAGTAARICCTRKTTPGLRALEKYAVRAGGGVNHRFGLDDGILVKDNHAAWAGGVGLAVERARAGAGHMVRVEAEVDTLAQLDEALSAGADAVLLDNMDPPTLRRAVARIAGRALAEASGSLVPANARAVAETGVDLLSSGWITQSAPALDLGLDAD